MAWVRSTAIAVLIAGACVALVPSRGERSGPALLGDSISYVAMASGSSAAPAPFRYRIVVAALARALPLDPAHAFAIVSLISLIATYALVLQTSRRLGLTDAAACTGLVVAVFTAPHLYNYENPYLTDAAGLLVVAACLHALVTRRYSWFVGVCAIGMGIREASIFATPAWASTRQWRRSAFAILASLAVYVAIHRWIGPLSPTDPGPFKEFPARPLHDVVADLLCAWHGLWFAMPVGLWLLPSHRREMGWMAGSLGVGTLVTSLLASDTMRMAEPLFPVIALGVAAFVAALWERSKGLTAFLVGGSVACSVLWQPVRFLPSLTTATLPFRALAVALLTMTALAGVAQILGAAPRPRLPRGTGGPTLPDGISRT